MPHDENITDPLAYLVDNLQERFPECYISATVTSETASLSIHSLPIKRGKQARLTHHFTRAELQAGDHILKTILEMFIDKIEGAMLEGIDE